MPSSDSEDFESADEGHTSPDKLQKKERKQRLSSSNYSDTLETDHEFKTPKKEAPSVKPEKKQTDGWDDFDIDDNEAITSDVPKMEQESCKIATEMAKEPSKDTGWDDFDDWDVASNTTKVPVTPQKQFHQEPEPNIKDTDRMASSGSGWGWGWSVDSLLSTASSGITSITSQVSQGITTVLETGIGAPDPEELARKSTDTAPAKTSDGEKPEPSAAEEDDPFQFGDLVKSFSGLTKFVGSTGTKVLAGGLDTLETIGKKTMEVLQDGDPGLAKKRAMLGLDPVDKPILSQILREAKQKADEEDRIREERKEAKQVHFETLFDDYEGLVHLEALEMLSRQVTMRIEERLKSADAEKRQDIKETLQQVAELCELPEESDDEEQAASSDKAEDFHERLQTATQDLGLKLQFQPLVKQYQDTLDWLANTESPTDKEIYKRCISSLAECCALCVQSYHKGGELLLTKPRRSTADEADAYTQMTVVLTKHITELATLFTDKLNSIPTENKDQINTYITNIFLEAESSQTYLQNAFQLSLPILQIGAV